MPERGYVDRDALRDTVRVGGTGFPDDRYDRVISAASRWIDERCSDRELGIIRHFWRDDTPTGRVYHATNPHQVDVGDFVDPEEVAVLIDPVGDGTWEPVAGDAWGAGPVNRFPDSPFTQIVTNGYRPIFPMNLSPGVKVVTRWGYGSVPAPVATACEILCFAALLGKDVIGQLGRNATFSTSGNSPADPFVLAERFLIPYLPASRPPTQLVGTA